MWEREEGMWTKLGGNYFSWGFCLTPTYTIIFKYKESFSICNSYIPASRFEKYDLIQAYL